MSDVDDACRHILARISGALEEKGLPEPNQEAILSIAKDIQNRFSTKRGYAFHEVISLTHWHVQLGELVEFDALFGERGSEDCIRAVRKWKEVLTCAFREADTPDFEKTHHEVVSEAMHHFAADYSRMIKDILKRLRHVDRMKDGDVFTLDDDFEEIGMYREIAQRVRYAAIVIGLPAESMCLSEVSSWDRQLLEAQRTLQTRVGRETSGADRSASERIKALAIGRYLSPPEVYPWGWVSLEEEEQKPLSIIFGFDPEEVRKKLETVRKTECQRKGG